MSQEIKEKDRSVSDLSQIINGMAIPAFVIDSRHIVTHWNRACEKLTGVPAADVIGTQDAWKAFYPAKRPLLADLVVDRSIEEVIAEYYQGKYEKSVLVDNAYEAQDFFPNLGKGGKWLYFTATRLMDLSNNIVGAIETFQDLTKRKEAEKSLRESDRLHAVIEMAGAVCHEMNQPLMVLSGISELLALKLSEEDSLQSTIQKIGEQIEKLASITHKLMNITRYETKNYPGGKIIDIDKATSS
jgi:signal transduction histidine kinase